MLPVLLILQSLIYGIFAISSVLRVETGHQTIEIQGRDPYKGYFARLRFHEQTCIQSLIVHCLRPLTGAEEIDLLYSECTRGQWKVAHYTNTKEEFRLKIPIHARELSITSRKPLTIIDVQVRSCPEYNTASVSKCDLSSDHTRRHGRTGPLRAIDNYRTRRKRAVSPSFLNYPENSEYVFTEDKIVASGETMTVQKGARLKFADGVGLIVHGALIVNGSKQLPVQFSAHGNKWKGVQIIDASSPSSLSHLNVSESEVGVSVQGQATPTFDDVIVDGNDVGIRIESNSTDPVHIRNSYALNNGGTGFHFLGKVDQKLP